jgi:hypothetical protein
MLFLSAADAAERNRHSGAGTTDRFRRGRHRRGASVAERHLCAADSGHSKFLGSRGIARRFVRI